MAPSRSTNAGRRRSHDGPDDDNDESTSRDFQAAVDDLFPPASSHNSFSRPRHPRSRADPGNHHDPPLPSVPDSQLRSGSRRRPANDPARQYQYQYQYQYESQPMPSRAGLSTESTALPPDSMESGDKFTTEKMSLTNAAMTKDQSIRDDVREYIRKRKARKNEKKKARMTKPTWKDQLGSIYQKVILETILRRFPLPPSADGRHIPLDTGVHRPKGLIDERRNKPYISNFIRSSRYTIYNFVPMQLIFQFSKLGNFYFLVMGILQLIPGLSTVGRWTTIAPLGVFVAFSMAKEGYDDYRRYKLDRVENRSEAWVLADRMNEKDARNAEKKMKRRMKKEKNSENSEEHMLDDLEIGTTGTTTSPGSEDWVLVQWEHIRVGDIIRLRRDDGVPADIALLHATGPSGIAYIETMALDGETNLKSKQACPLLAERCNTLGGLRATKATVVSEDPNLDLYSYDGRVTIGDETMPLSLNNVVYRGSTLRNTTEAIGLVINSGEECKIRMNANRNVRAKTPAMQSTINRIVLFQIFIVLMLAMGLTIGYHLWEGETENDSFYLRNAGVPFVEIFFGYLIMFNTLIPLSLYISLEIIKLGQLLLLQDPEMYDPISDTPMVANTTTILENLGQVSYVFSDKTGTLTDNVMRFRKLSVAGVACLHDMDIQRDEDAKFKRIKETARPKKGKAKDKTLVPTTTITKPIDDYDDESTQGEVLHKRPGPSRTSSTRSISQWRSSVRPNEEAEMKTEDLLDYIRRKPNTTFSRKAKHFLLCIALCHTCLPERKDNGEIDFQAASPDELALVQAARDLGLLLIDRPAQSIKIQTVDEHGSLQTETYQVLDVIEFSSKRKRMTIIIRMPDGRICVFCKGADNVIMSRLRLNQMAEQKALDIGRRASVRKTSEQGRMVRRLSAQASSNPGSPRNSFTLRRGESSNRLENLRLSLSRRSTDINRLSQSQSFPFGRSPRASMDLRSPVSPGQGLGRMPSFEEIDLRIDESVAANDGAIFEKCFQHVDDFASEGLRTLMYAYRYVDDDSYAEWKELYREAETSLVDRQDRIEEAGELIEQKFELAGATAIEDKLQEGVPDTIDKLRRANIKVWMLTGDKRETAINIGHSARVCKPFSELYILDATLGNLRDTLTVTLNNVCRGMAPHTVVVVDGQTLAAIDADTDLAFLFYDLVVRVDSVICCRASPSQKANLVQSIRKYVPKSMTLAIGDGANDIGMIQASHVGIGISGREGLQASRISDYSIAQFRFLQKLLLVHGRWNYLRTGKYVLATFWKEILFFLVQAHFQRLNGYSGTSLYESWSLTVFNSAFTSLPVILLGIFERDLSAETLMAVPELYTFGQRGKGFSYLQYVGWLIMGVGGSFVIWYFTSEVYHKSYSDDDTSIFAMGMVGFTVAVVFINFKLLVLELHSKTIITFAGLIISVGGWFIWILALSGLYARRVGIYIVRDAFIYNFGRELQWWTTVLLQLTTLVVAELVVQSVRRVYWPTDQDLMQRLEKDNEVHTLFQDNEKDLEDGQVEVVDGDTNEKRGRQDLAVPTQTRTRTRSPHSPRPSFQDSSWKQSRASHDDYRPQFTSTAEEHEHPVEHYGRAL
ncbi:drs2 neo1 protein [Neonectria punicea]|uniref:Phospholipid-transporting ATPase n=1 Tax=Neonectria punicea TaxID=979145 RepID=A0ABR1GYI5_9HYPO